jgi:hypothetical protein
MLYPGQFMEKSWFSNVRHGSEAVAPVKQTLSCTATYRQLASTGFFDVLNPPVRFRLTTKSNIPLDQYRLTGDALRLLSATSGHTRIVANSHECGLMAAFRRSPYASNLIEATPAMLRFFSDLLIL